MLVPKCPLNRVYDQDKSLERKGDSQHHSSASVTGSSPVNKHTHKPEEVRQDNECFRYAELAIIFQCWVCMEN